MVENDAEDDNELYLNEIQTIKYISNRNKARGANRHDKLLKLRLLCIARKSKMHL